MKNCDFGCNNEAKYILKNKKLCCSKSSNGCSKVKEKKKNSFLILDDEQQICSYGCNKIAKYRLSNGKFCCKNYYRHCPQFRLELSESKMGDKNPCKGHTEENKKRWREQRRGKNNSMFGKKHSEEAKKKIGVKSKQKIFSEEYREKLRITSTGRKQSKEQREKSRQRMLNGLASYMHKFKKNPSREELKLKTIVLEFYPEAEPQHTIFNYSVDIALVDKKIVIEYDGYYHFNTEENKKYHENRQKRIEGEGWRFLRYTMFDKFPTAEKVKEDLKKLI